MRTAVRVTCVLLGLALIAGTATDMVLKNRAYSAWLETNAAELGEAQRAIRRHERRIEAKMYRKMPASVEIRDAEAAEVAEPVVRRLETERVAMFATKKDAMSRFRIALAVAIVLFVIARMLTPRMVARW